MKCRHRRRSKERRRAAWLGWTLTGLALVGLLVSACGANATEANQQNATAILSSPLATAASPQEEAGTAMPSPSAVPATPTDIATAAPSPLATATPLPAPVKLVVLHTNDNWGETEPCG